MNEQTFNPGDKVESADFLCDVKNPLTVREVHNPLFTTVECSHNHSVNRWKLAEPKVTLEQVREFVAGHEAKAIISEVLLDFIDNGPPKPDANEILSQARKRNSGKTYVEVFYAQRDALRDALLLKETI